MGGKTQVGYQRCEKTEGSLGHSGLLSLVCRETGQVLLVLPENVCLLADFRKNQWLQVTGSMLIIKNRSALQSLVDGAGS